MIGDIVVGLLMATYHQASKRASLTGGGIQSRVSALMFASIKKYINLILGL